LTDCGLKRFWILDFRLLIALGAVARPPLRDAQGKLWL